MKRSTIDVVIIMLTTMVSITIIASTIIIAVGKVKNPALDTTRAGELIGNILTTVVGALVGFMGGRAAGRMEGANGNDK